MPTADWLPGSDWCRGGRRSFHAGGMHTDTQTSTPREAHLGSVADKWETHMLKETKRRGDVYLLVRLGDSVGVDGSKNFEPGGRRCCVLVARQSWLQHCLLNRMTLFALSLLFLPLLLLLLQYTPPSSPLDECWQRKLHSSAVFPLCRSRSCMSSAYLCGMGLFKGERSLQGQCACVRACASAHFISLLSTSPPCPPPHLHPHPNTPV